MESLTADKGIFLKSSNLESSFMLKSIQELLNIQPSSKIAGFCNDKTYKGFKVYFEEHKSTSVLLKKFLCVSNEYVELFPVSTFLTIHDLYMSENDSCKDDVRQEIEKNFGKVLNLHPTPDGTPSFLNKNWRVEIDVPEMKAAFNKGNSLEMSISLLGKSRPFKVTFWCRRCRTDGHAQQDCLQDNIMSQSGSRAKSVNGEPKKRKQKNIKMTSVSRSEENSPPSTSLAVQIGKEEAMKVADFQKEKQGKTGEGAKSHKSISSSQSDVVSTVNKDSRTKNESKNSKEVKSTEANTSDFHAREMNQPSNVTVKQETDIDALQNEDTFPFSGATDSHNSDDEDVRLADMADDLYLATKAALKKAEEVNSSSRKPVTAQPKDANPSSGESSLDGRNFNRVPSTTSNTFASTSCPGTSTVSDTSNLSERLLDCFSRAYNDHPILGDQQLQAFLIHVKKKSNPLRIAGNYTRNAIGLKDQLKQILYYYYNTPQTGTKDDIQFVKWLNGLVERFEGTPAKKRKRTKSDDAPYKK